MFKAILFDFDGTLVDSNLIIFDAAKYALEKLQLKQDITQELLASIFYEDTEVLKNKFEKEIANKLVHHALFYYENNRLYRPLHAGILHLLKQFQILETPLGIVTNRTKPVVQATLSHNQIQDYFSAIVTADDVESLKPSPEGILKATTLLQVKPAQTLYVGDTPQDVRAARAAGVCVVAATWDRMAQKTTMEALWPDYLAEEPSSIFQIWKEYGFYLPEKLEALNA